MLSIWLYHPFHPYVQRSLQLFPKSLWPRATGAIHVQVPHRVEFPFCRVSQAQRIEKGNFKCALGLL
jgi:hypothetical protein